MLEILDIVISEDIKKYLNSLTSTYSSIQEIWLFGSRANPPYEEDSDWDFLVFANSKVLTKLQREQSFKRDDVDLLIIWDGNHFESPWPRPPKKTKAGVLFPSSESCENFNWTPVSETEATYLATKSSGNGGWDIVGKRAYRIYPEKN